mmetsp:Transcript_42919/g.100779  ORF Transcript_42919/g.100779 Transcript_42919/m.100779 type:complete len:652 (+) Transcript_42919:63-2018(+)
MGMRFIDVLPTLLAMHVFLASAQDTTNCHQHTLDFVLTGGDSLAQHIEDDIKADLAKVGITLNTIPLEKDLFNQAMSDGAYHLAFTETWGPPYDPHSFAAGWFGDSAEAHYTALEGMSPPLTKPTLQDRVTQVLRETSEPQRQEKWAGILQDLHEQAISFPLWSRVMPAVWRRSRMTGYVPGVQQFEYPMHTVRILAGSSTVTVAPGGQQGIFAGDKNLIGRMDPHSYRPNEFFINDWIYEGLVSYGPDGTILPQLAAEVPSPVDLPDGKQQWTFKIREGVKFHDGTDCDCAAIKMNFDHAMALPLTTADWHGWYHLPGALDSWECLDTMTSHGHTFVVTLKEPYYPFLQELCFIRPMRILSPQSFSNGAASDPRTHNSCPIGWGLVEGLGTSVNCTGTTAPVGTGPWKYDNHALTADGEALQELHFARNEDWWGWGPQSNVDRIHVIRYESAQAVEAALLDGSLDMVVGGGVLTPPQVHEFQTTHVEDFAVVLGPPLMNRIVVINAAKEPTNDVELRKVIIHAVNKAAIAATEMAGMADIADSLFPKDAPYCHVDLTPRWDYDFQKARLLNCPEMPTVTEVIREVEVSGSDDDDDTGLIVGLAFGLGIPLLLVVGAACFFAGKKKGYSDLDARAPKSTGNGNVVGTPASA